jgi:prepilin signal peptidase PulO-like enzyme (type II secretory pathway)
MRTEVTGSAATDRTIARRRLVVPAVSVFFGLAYLVAGLVGGDPGFGLVGLGVMVAFALIFVLLARRSETVEGLLDRRDERINAIDRDASLIAGLAVLLTVLGMFVIEIARGEDGSPYYQLAAVGGVFYLGSVVVLRWVR